MPDDASRPMLRVYVELFDEVLLQLCREVIAEILLVARADAFGREIAPSVTARVAGLSAATYAWHLLAWRMQGFKRGNWLGRTPAGEVYVQHAGIACLGNPRTGNIIELVVPVSAALVSSTATLVPQSSTLTH